MTREKKVLLLGCEKASWGNESTRVHERDRAKIETRRIVGEVPERRGTKQVAVEVVT